MMIEYKVGKWKWLSSVLIYVLYTSLFELELQ